MLNENLIKGQIIELKVQEELLRYGFDVSIPSYNASRYDIIADTGKELLKIQVKKSLGTNAKNGSFSFNCTSQNVTSKTGCKHKYTIDEVDYFATVWKNKVYFIPIDETSKTKTLTPDNEEYLSENIFSSYHRLSDEELFDYTSSGIKYCIDCGCQITSKGKRCVACNNKNSQIVERPSREVLKDLIRTTPFTKIGKQYNVTDNAIRKWCDSYNLPRRARDIKKYSDKEWESI